jgi:hypothetical protein
VASPARSTGLEAVAAPTAEGGTKPEYDAITQVNLVPQAFGRWTDITEQAVEAMGGINDLVAAHARQIALDEDSYLIGLMVTEAGTAQAFIADVQANVRTAIATIESTVAAKADIIVVNPANYALLAPTTPANAGDVASSLVSFSGALLYPSAAVPTGFVLVAALAAVARYVTATDLRTTVQPRREDEPGDGPHRNFRRLRVPGRRWCPQRRRRHPVRERTAPAHRLGRGGRLRPGAGTAIQSLRATERQRVARPPPAPAPAAG